MNPLPKTLVSAFFATLLLAGCVSTQVRDYSDTRQRGYVAHRIAILAQTPDVGLAQQIEGQLSEGLAAHGVSTIHAHDVLPPTRGYSADEVQKAFSAAGADSLIIIETAGGQVQSQDIGAYTSGSAYGHAFAQGPYVYGGAQGSATTTRIRAFKRDTNAFSSLYRMDTGEVIWRANSETNAGGALYMSDGSTAGDLVRGILEALAKRGHVPPKK